MAIGRELALQKLGVINVAAALKAVKGLADLGLVGAGGVVAGVQLEIGVKSGRRGAGGVFHVSLGAQALL